MADSQLLLRTSVSNGLLLSLVLTIIMAFSFALAPDMWVGDYPPDVKGKYGPMSPRARSLRPYVAALFFITIFLVPLLGLFSLEAKVDRLPFVPALTFAGISLLIFNVFDLLVLDWLLFCTLRPRWIVLPGTEGMTGYRDYTFHFIGFLKGLVFCAIGALLISGVWVVVQSLTT